ncbi:hypothetical protein [Actinomadura sp. 6K520]|uniref:hypothetical protein n=1 Tax=Actinomadura sp. 6K520 TaxID=2530364 RepID=UPI0010485F27|nr:hypothetical protein [Actinomadura sp. 6K520]TDE32808.1 hypothetical protein E1289_14235 [Actinomadura sp. 6K520]
MLRCAASPLQRLISCSDPARSAGPGTGATCLDDARAALALITMWSIQTGKTLPAVPIEQLTARQLEDFWADDSMLDFRLAPRPRLDRR